ACWRRILSWPSRMLLTYHDAPGSGFVGDGRAALKAAVERAGQLVSVTATRDCSVPVVLLPLEVHEGGLCLDRPHDLVTAPLRPVRHHLPPQTLAGYVGDRLHAPSRLPGDLEIAIFRLHVVDDAKPHLDRWS